LPRFNEFGLIKIRNEIYALAKGLQEVAFHKVLLKGL
jgi:hypothetical protein